MHKSPFLFHLPPSFYSHYPKQRRVNTTCFQKLPRKSELTLFDILGCEYIRTGDKTLPSFALKSFSSPSHHFWTYSWRKIDVTQLINISHCHQHCQPGIIIHLCIPTARSRLSYFLVCLKKIKGNIRAHFCIHFAPSGATNFSTVSFHWAQTDGRSDKWMFWVVKASKLAKRISKMVAWLANYLIKSHQKLHFLIKNQKPFWVVTPLSSTILYLLTINNLIAKKKTAGSPLWHTGGDPWNDLKRAAAALKTVWRQTRRLL